MTGDDGREGAPRATPGHVLRLPSPVIRRTRTVPTEGLALERQDSTRAGPGELRPGRSAPGLQPGATTNNNTTIRELLTGWRAASVHGGGAPRRGIACAP